MREIKIWATAKGRKRKKDGMKTSRIFAPKGQNEMGGALDAAPRRAPHGPLFPTR